MSNIQEIETSVGTFMASRVEFYENGAVKSAEPEQQVFFSHQTGLYIAFDNAPLKDEEHLPTLEFEPDGRVKALRTIGTGLICRPKDGEKTRGVVHIGAEWRPDPRNTGANVLIPIRIQFFEEELRVTDSDGQEHQLPFDVYDIQVDYLTDNIVMGGGCGDCSTCNGGCSVQS